MTVEQALEKKKKKESEFGSLVFYKKNKVHESNHRWVEHFKYLTVMQ